MDFFLLFEKVTDKSKKTIYGPLFSNPEYSVIESTSKIDQLDLFDETNYSTVELTFHLKRNVSNYFYFLILPHTLSILFCITMFKFEIYSGIRILFAVISMLLDLQIIYSISSQLGLQIFQTPLIGKF